VRAGDADDCARAILALCDDPETYGRARARVAQVRGQLLWHRTVEPLAELIDAPQSLLDAGPAVQALALQYALARLRLELRASRPSRTFTRSRGTSTAGDTSR